MDLQISFLQDREKHARWKIDNDEWYCRRVVEGWDDASQLRKMENMAKKMAIMGLKMDMMKLYNKIHWRNRFGLMPWYFKCCVPKWKQLYKEYENQINMLTNNI